MSIAFWFFSDLRVNRALNLSCRNTFPDSLRRLALRVVYASLEMSMARAMVMLNRYDHALELVGADTSPDALEVRAEAAWKAKDWPAAGRWAEQRLGQRWTSIAPSSTPLQNPCATTSMRPCRCSTARASPTPPRT